MSDINKKKKKIPIGCSASKAMAVEGAVGMSGQEFSSAENNMKTMLKVF